MSAEVRHQTATVVHNFATAPSNARLRLQVVAVVHTETEAGGGGGALPPIQGQAAQGNTVQGLLNPKIQGS